MKKQTIEVEGLPEGWNAVAYRVPVNGENFFYDEKICNDKYQCHEYLIVEKIQPRRIVLEETNEERKICFGEWYESQEGKLMRWPYGGKTDGKHKVWREVKETNEESKLSLSVDECRNVRSLIKDFENLGWFVNPARSLLLQKITEFIKDK